MSLRVYINRILVCIKKLRQRSTNQGNTKAPVQQQIITYHGIIAAEVEAGTNFLTDMLSSVTDFLRGRSGGYEQELNQAR